MSAALYSTALRYVREKRALGEFAPLTARGASYILSDFSGFTGDQFPVSRLTRRHVERWLMSLEVAESTRRTRYSRVRAFCRWCVDHDLLRRDPCRGLRGPSEGDTIARGFTTEEVGRALEIPDERGVVILLLAVQEGMRRAEIVRLTTSDIDWDDRTLIAHGKAKKDRVVPVSDETLEAIDRYLTVWPAGPHTPLIRSYQYPTRPLCGDHVSRLVASWLKEAGVKRRAYDGKCLHAGRHTAAHDVLDKSRDLRVVRDFLGHTSVAVTAQYERRKVAADRLREATGGRRYMRLT